MALKEESSDHDAAPPSPTRRKQPDRKAAGLQMFESESEEDNTVPESDAFDKKTKSQEARKKPNDPDAVAK